MRRRRSWDNGVVMASLCAHAPDHHRVRSPDSVQPQTALKSEITDLKGEIRELTRANREQVEKIEALRAEIAKLRADAKVRKPNGMTAGAEFLGRLQPSLS